MEGPAVSRRPDWRSAAPLKAPTDSVLSRLAQAREQLNEAHQVCTRIELAISGPMTEEGMGVAAAGGLASAAMELGSAMGALVQRLQRIEQALG